MGCTADLERMASILDPHGAFEAKALGQSIFTKADTLEELRECVEDAVACHFDEEEGPKIIRLHFVREAILAA